MRYDGPYPHDFHLDNGNYHGAFQDFDVDLRYRLKSGPLVVTPFFESIIPSHMYGGTHAHAGFGREMREFRPGLNLGRRLDPWLRNAFVQAKFSYGFVERVIGVHHNTINGEAQIGYFVKPRWALIALGTWLHTINHYPFADRNVTGPPPPELLETPFWLHHDQVGRFRMWNVGGGSTYQVSPHFAIFGMGTTTVWSANVQALAKCGLTW